jgi:hypothetical protein
MSTSSTDSTYPSICFPLLRISHNAINVLPQPLQLEQSTLSSFVGVFEACCKRHSTSPAARQAHAPARLVMLFLDAEYASTGARRLLGSDYAASSLSLHLTPLDGHTYPTQVISCTAHRSSPRIISYIALMRVSAGHVHVPPSECHASSPIASQV